MSTEIVDITDLDCIYLSYDEPQKEEFWVKIKNMVPWARRVDGVKGSDAAHKAAAEASTTERFILIDGDNMPDEDFFNIQLDFTNKDPSFKKAQFRWKAVNAINGLRYGNGGMSSWTKEYVMNMKTHEASDGNDTTTVDFCLDYQNSIYWSMYDCYSTTYPNYSPFQAWRAGFREGVKMCLVGGKRKRVDIEKHKYIDEQLINENFEKIKELALIKEEGEKLRKEYNDLSEQLSKIDAIDIQSFESKSKELESKLSEPEQNNEIYEKRIKALEEQVAEFEHLRHKNRGLIALFLDLIIFILFPLIILLASHYLITIIFDNWLY